MRVKKAIISILADHISDRNKIKIAKRLAEQGGIIEFTSCNGLSTYGDGEHIKGTNRVEIRLEENIHLREFRIDIEDTLKGYEDELIYFRIQFFTEDEKKTFDIKTIVFYLTGVDIGFPC